MSSLLGPSIQPVALLKEMLSKEVIDSERDNKFIACCLLGEKDIIKPKVLRDSEGLL